MWICMKRSTGSSLRLPGKALEGASDHVWAGRGFLCSCHAQHPACDVAVAVPLYMGSVNVNSLWQGSKATSLSWPPLPLCRQLGLLILENLV